MHYEAGTVHVEPGFSAAAIDELERRGYRVVRWKGLNLYFGGAQAARRDPATASWPAPAIRAAAASAVVVDVGDRSSGRCVDRTSLLHWNATLPFALRALGDVRAPARRA